MVAAQASRGRDTVPVLVAPEAVLAESEDILGYADDHLPAEQRLIPDEPALRDEVLALSRWLDAGLGPDGRRLMYVADDADAGPAAAPSTTRASPRGRTEC